MTRNWTIPAVAILAAGLMLGSAQAQQGGGKGGGGGGGGNGDGGSPSEIFEVLRSDAKQRELAEAFRVRMAGRACLTHACAAPPPRNHRPRGNRQRVQLTAACVDDVIIMQRMPASGAAVYACGRTAVR